MSSCQGSCGEWVSGNGQQAHPDCRLAAVEIRIATDRDRPLAVGCGRTTGLIGGGQRLVAEIGSHERDRSSPFRGPIWLSGRAAQHNRLDFQALCIAAQDVVQSCHVFRAGSLGTGQVQGVAGA